MEPAFSVLEPCLPGHRYGFSDRQSCYYAPRPAQCLIDPSGPHGGRGMLRTIATVSLIITTALPLAAQDRSLKWQNLDPATVQGAQTALATVGFDPGGMRPLALIVSEQTCRAGCTVRDAGCACPKSGNSCPDGTSETPGGALCSGPLSAIQVMFEDGRISDPFDLP